MTGFSLVFESASAIGNSQQPISWRGIQINGKVLYPDGVPASDALVEAVSDCPAGRHVEKTRSYCKTHLKGVILQ